jgi:hypothetical protein
MEKAYDLKVLVEKLKGHGLEIAEATAKAVTLSIFDWLDESASISPTPYDDMLKVLYPIVKGKLLEVEDKINPNG